MSRSKEKDMKRKILLSENQALRGLLGFRLTINKKII